MLTSLPGLPVFKQKLRVFFAKKPMASSGLLFLNFLILFLPLNILWISHQAQAQSQQEAEAEEEAMEAQRQEEARKKALSKAPPSALPGVENSYEEPSIHSNNDTNPTQALFEAINKGSMNAAREALSRGADITARNVLEQTPLDMAIDLNRNNIVFLLLSLRGYNPEGHLIKTASHENDGNMPSNVSGTAAMHLANPKKEEPLYDPSGGVPIPAIGFLGYGPVTNTKIAAKNSGLTPLQDNNPLPSKKTPAALNAATEKDVSPTVPASASDK